MPQCEGVYPIGGIREYKWGMILTPSRQATRISKAPRLSDCHSVAKILDPLTGDALQPVCSPSDGVVFFSHTKPLVHQYSRLFQVLSAG